jgi:hypothetical protein
MYKLKNLVKVSKKEAFSKLHMIKTLKENVLTQKEIIKMKNQVFIDKA